MRKNLFLFLLLCELSIQLVAQIHLSGRVIDTISRESIAFVNIGIKQQNIGTYSLEDGCFALIIPKQNQNDTLTFSMIGYAEWNLPLREMQGNQSKNIALVPKALALPTVFILAPKLVEKKLGIVKYNPLFNLLDGSTNQNDIFEIAELISFGSTLSKVKSVNLHINESSQDSSTFRINFYAFDNQKPSHRIVEKSIIQTHPIKEGWLSFNLAPYNIYLQGEVIVGIEFIPKKQRQSRILYEIKMGGKHRSFVRNSSLGEWTIPPHHYRMFVTVLTEDKKQKEEEDIEQETLATSRLYSQFVQDSFSIFVHVPPQYKQSNRKYPTVYVLDANVYYDPLSNVLISVKGNKVPPEVILIGIGYKDFFTMNLLRDRDYTYPSALASDSFLISGGAENFLSFIEKELIPYIDKSYRTNQQNRALMGHSLGGYFTLFALHHELQNQSHFFKNYVAASPSLEYCDSYIMKQFEQLSAIIPNKGKRNLLLTTEGQDEGKVYETNIRQFTQFLTYLNRKDIELKSQIYTKFEHMETAIPSFEQGLLLGTSTK